MYKGGMIMGNDRSSTTEIGDFTLSVDRDHRGKYRGKQVMTENYRGWHYHIEHPEWSQEKIMKELEKELDERTELRRSIDYDNLSPEEKKTVEKRINKWLEGLSEYNNQKVHIEYNSREVSWKESKRSLKYTFPKSVFRGIDLKRYQKKEGSEWVDISENEWIRLIRKKTKTVHPSVAIGTVETNPAKISVYRLDDKTTVLWLSGFNGKLHIEADKSEEYAKTILKKKELTRILKKWSKED